MCCRCPPGGAGISENAVMVARPCRLRKVSLHAAASRLLAASMGIGSSVHAGVSSTASAALVRDVRTQQWR